MKIVYIVPHLKLYGGIRRIIEFCNALHDKGHDVFIANEQYPETCSWMKVNPPIISLEDMYSGKWDAAIFSLESQYKLVSKLQARTVIHYILHYGVIYKDRSECLKSYTLPTYKTTNSSWTAKKLQEHIGYAPPIVYGWINTDIFHPVDTPKIYDVLTYGDPTREWKGRGDVEVVESEMPHLRFAYMSDINPQQSQIAKVYSSAKIFISASWYEGWKWMALEAMACGVPVITTVDGGSGDYAKNGYNCLVTPVGGIEQMVSSINTLLNDNKYSKKLIDNGIAMVKKFDKKSSITSFEGHLHAAIKKEERSKTKTQWYLSYHR